MVATAVTDDVQGDIGFGVPEATSWLVEPLQKVSEPVIVGFKFTIIVIVVGKAQRPAVGVNV